MKYDGITRFAPALVVGIPLLLGGCANPPPISASPIQNAAGLLGGAGTAGDLVTNGILNAKFNLDSAVTVGALPTTDPAPACVDQAVVMMGLGGTPAASFVPKITDAISAGSVGYIYFQQVKTLTGGNITLPQSCLAILGQMVLDVQKGVNQAAIGALIPGVGGLLPSIGLRPAPVALENNPSLGGR